MFAEHALMGADQPSQQFLLKFTDFLKVTVNRCYPYQTTAQEGGTQHRSKNRQLAMDFQRVPWYKKGYEHIYAFKEFLFSDLEMPSPWYLAYELQERILAYTRMELWSIVRFLVNH